VVRLFLPEGYRGNFEGTFGKDTINTVAEHAINQKMEKMGDSLSCWKQFSRVNWFPYGVTFTSKNTKEITYFTFARA
jgi:hypothetical protein